MINHTARLEVLVAALEDYSHCRRNLALGSVHREFTVEISSCCLGRSPAMIDSIRTCDKVNG